MHAYKLDVQSLRVAVAINFSLAEFSTEKHKLERDAEWYFFTPRYKKFTPMGADQTEMLVVETGDQRQRMNQSFIRTKKQLGTNSL